MATPVFDETNDQAPVELEVGGTSVTELKTPKVKVTLLKLPNKGVAPATAMVASRETVDQFQSAACVAVITALPAPIKVAVLPEIFAIFSLDDLKDQAPADVDVGGVNVYTGLFKLCEGIENTPTVGTFPATTTEIFLLMDKKSAVAA